ncbi:MAG: type III-B CRISPR-associated protein Cas10/Cmr2 [Calothrix sp. C42_A2020_038]|nr:type III-B CRISPR-associated protein Cas10/Cmr2 [Calothrix sp. C42_A2020_038]
MSRVFWQSKIWGILHDPALKALHNNTGRGGNSFWQQLPVMQDWVDNQWNPEDKSGKAFKQMKLADYIASSSDRGAIGSISESVNYNEHGLEVAHLLSGAKLNLKIPDHQTLVSKRLQYLTLKEQELSQLIPESIQDDVKQVFWWLWRCLPEAVCQQFGDDSLMLMPAETRLPDSSIWSHTSMTAALTGALVGYDATTEDLILWKSGKEPSHPYLVTFSFTPVQDLIKASRKMRDFWAGSWTLHYIAAKICWKLAMQYGPDSLLYPSLFQQPLIDHWLLTQYPAFDKWVKQPSPHNLLTAGFPNVIVMILPEAKVEAAMQTAEQTLKQVWQQLGILAFEELHGRHWMHNLNQDSKTWQGWLKAQWQFYWAGVPIGNKNEELKNAAIPIEEKDKFDPWVETQNQTFNSNLYQQAELDFLRQACEERIRRQNRKFSVNVGSWWSSIFDQTRCALASTKNARSWQLPTAFAPRSTISGIGPVVHPGEDWTTEGETKKHWERHAGLFDGREQLNATETVKRVLEKILPNILGLDKKDIQASYPDLTAGVAGYLKVMEQNDHWQNFQQVCTAITCKYPWAEKVIQQMEKKWGIPWMDSDLTPRLPSLQGEGEELKSLSLQERDLEISNKKYHPRLLNAGWLIEDAEIEELEVWEDKLRNEDDEQIKEVLRQEISKIKQKYRQDIQTLIDRYYPNNNPSDWYVLAAGDGDGMSQWLKGKKMRPLREYVPAKVLALAQNNSIFDKFLDLPKHMGPSTHSALSRALLDFSNQLVPYLTEQRYAGRLIYGGGDDVLAYTNLWEWDKWLWDIRQCFRGDQDPCGKFQNNGDYWQWVKFATDDLSVTQSSSNTTDNLSIHQSPSVTSVAKRPLFTMGRNATISFGVVMAHHSVPLAIALENMWGAEKEAKKYVAPNGNQKDAVQVRVLYGNGNMLKATAKFDVFHQWQQLLTVHPDIQSSIFEQAANLWNQHPAPTKEAIRPWTLAFCERRDLFNDDLNLKLQFQDCLSKFLMQLWQTTAPSSISAEVQNWLKISAFTLRNRDIKLGGDI